MEEEGVWRTIRGRRIFIKEGQDLKSALKESNKFDNLDKTNKKDIINKFVEKKKSNNKIDYKTDHQKAVEEFDKDIYPDNDTYDIETKKAVSFDNGYQATFWQTGDNYSNSEYNRLTEEMLKLSSDGKSYAGKFGGKPEISFHFNDLTTAVKIMEKYNQVSIWDWQFQTEIKNQRYEKGKGNDY